ncbi:MAG: GNAT family N-acetyltransferase [Chloroflexi bacterium]|nr:GNAT family N-acetyltransferase [Chloroflexota bacterium]
MTLQIKPLDELMAREMVAWRYESPYDVYNFSSDEAAIADVVKYYADSKNSAYAMTDSEHGLIGFCSFGEDAKVGGGDYTVDALDLGMGIRPDMTGQGNGTVFALKTVDFAIARFKPNRLRVAVAKFNRRAQKVWQNIGFVMTVEFTSTFDGSQYVMMVHEVMQL